MAKLIRLPNEDTEFQKECAVEVKKGFGKSYEKKTIFIDGEEQEVQVNAAGDIVYRDRFGNVRNFRKERLDAGETISLEYQKGYDLRVTEKEDGTITAKVELGSSEKFIEKLLPYTSEKLRDKILTDGADMFKSMEEQIGEKPPEGYKEIKAAQDRARIRLANLHDGQEEIPVASAKESSGLIECRNCGKISQEGSNFCAGCGAKLN